MIDILNRPGYTVDEYPYPCIYKIIMGGSFYIGQIINLARRIQAHQQTLKSGNASHKMSQAYKENGGTFCVEIVEDIAPEKDHLYMNQREAYYIEKLNPSLNDEQVNNAYSREWAEKYCKGQRKLFEPVRKDLIEMSNAEAVKRYHAKMDEFKIRPSKEEGQKIREYAAAHGISVQGMFLDAVREYIAAHEKEGNDNGIS